MKGIIFTERLVNKMQRRNGDLPLILKQVAARDLSVVFMTKDVSAFCNQSIFDGRIKFKNVCIFKAYSGKKILTKELVEVLKKMRVPAEDMVFVSSEDKDYNIAKQKGMTFVLYSVSARHQKMPYITINKLTLLLEALEN